MLARLNLHFLVHRKYLLDIQRNKRVPDCFYQTESLFAHIPKTAGMSFCDSLYKEQVGHVPLAIYRAILGEEVFSRFFKFAIMRHPMDRLASAFFYLQRGGLVESELDREFSQTVLCRYESLNDFILDWLSPRSIYKYIHFFPQHYFVLDKRKRLLADYTGDFCNLDAAFSEICQRLGVQATLDVLNSSDHGYLSSDTYQVSQAAKHKVERLYRLDYALYEAVDG